MKHLIFAAGLVEAAGLGVMGQSLFVGTLPADVSDAVMLRDPLVGAEIDEGMRGAFKIGFQIIARNENLLDAYQRAQDVATALTVSDVGDDAIHVAHMVQVEKPVVFPRGDGDEVEASVRMSILFGEK